MVGSTATASRFIIFAAILLVLSPARAQDSVPWQRGDCNRDGRIDLSDAVGSIQFLFRGGAPVCQPLCDLDGNDRFDLSDAIRLIGHLFRGKDLDLPPPPAIPPETCDGSDNDCDGEVDEEACFTPVSVRLAWDPVDRDVEGNPEAVVGYALYYGTASRFYTRRLTIGLRTSHRVTGLEPDVPYFFAVTTIDAGGNESAFSNEVVTKGR